MTNYLSTEEVCGKLARAGCDEAEVGKVFAARLEPDGVDRDKKLVLAAEAPEGQVYLVLCQFGTGRALAKDSPFAEGGPDWRPRFISVNGPYPKSDLPALSAKAKELTGG
jgi:hypothetical protein